MAGLGADQARMVQISRLWTKAQPVVAAMIAGSVVDFHDAEDLVAQAAEVIVEKFDTYDPARPFLPWALGIGRNLVLRHYERRAGERQARLDAEALDALLLAHQAAADETSERLAALQSCMKAMRGKPRKVMEMRYLHDLKPDAIASALGTNRNAVWVMLHRLRLSLKACVEEKLLAQNGRRP